VTGPRAAHDAAWAEQWKREADELLTLAAWLSRDIPDPDFLLGEFLSTTARVELIGPTGIGKTNVLVAGALAVASGEDFLHWRGSGKPRRVLYVDGEMSRRLSKKRPADAVRRRGGKPVTFFFLNREDFPDLPPLNTEAGQEYIDAVIDPIGGVDFVVFDNVQALLSGDMKDEEPWQQTLRQRLVPQIIAKSAHEL
jgi:RecA/RadA recombinase